LRHLIKINIWERKGIAHTGGAPDGWLGGRGAGFEGEPPRRIVAVGDQFRYECGLYDRFRNRDRLGKRSCKPHGRLAISGNPTKRTSFTGVILGLQGRAIVVLGGPMSVSESMGMLRAWITVVDV